MNIWVDADACPVVIKNILFKAANRINGSMTFVANQPMYTPKTENIRFVLVRPGMDVADNEIVQAMEKGDLVITADIPLAAEAIGKGGYALSPRGEFFEADSIRERLSMRDFMESLRAGGVETGGPAAMQKSDRKKFADQLDKFLAGNNR